MFLHSLLPKKLAVKNLLITIVMSTFCLMCSWHMAYAAEEKKTDDKVKLFGSIEFRGSLKGLPQWARVQEKNLQNPIFLEEFKLNGGTTWANLKSKLEGKPLMEQLKIVNSFWNQWPYKQDPSVYKAPDYWAAPYEFRKNSGDCEDYAIVKYFTLREIGVPMEIMRVVVVKDTILNLAHAVLAVYIDGDAYVLDNLSRNVLSQKRIRNYIPQYSVNEKNRWMHVMPKK